MAYRANLVIVGSAGTGNYYCVQLGGEEPPLIIHDPGVPPAKQQREVVADDWASISFFG